MQKLVPYLTFNGDCRQALEFYETTIGGSIKLIQTFGEAPTTSLPPEASHYVMHSVFEGEGIMLMASDAMPSQTVAPGSQISLALQMDSVAEIDATFARLSEGGNVTVPLENTFWNARFGMLDDRFGISWMLNCQLDEEKPAS